MRTVKLYKLLLYLGLISLVYFSYLVYISYFPPNSTDMIQFIGELLTIPMLIFLLFSFFYSIAQVFKKVALKQYLLVFIVNTITLLLLLVITLIQI